MNIPPPLSSLDPDVLRQRIVDLGHAWAEASGAADLLEQARLSVLAEYKLKQPGKSNADRLDAALACEPYREHFRAMVSARTKANRAMVSYRAAITWVDLVRSKESTHRAEMTLR